MGTSQFTREGKKMRRSSSTSGSQRRSRKSDSPSSLHSEQVAPCSSMATCVEWSGPPSQRRSGREQRSCTMDPVPELARTSTSPAHPISHPVAGHSQRRSSPEAIAGPSRRRSSPEVVAGSSRARIPQPRVDPPRRGGPPPVAATRRRFRPGVKALTKIRQYQRSTGFLIPKQSFSRLIREIAEQMTIRVPLRWETNALAAMQEAAEAFLVHILEDSYLCLLQAKRMKLMLGDVRLARRIRGSHGYF